jgi:transcriptional regulator with XRE-family HTH domain
MGQAARSQPERLAEKLLQIRERLKPENHKATDRHLSQTEMLLHLGLSQTYHRSVIALWESGRREPPLKVLLLYARAYGISTDVLIDDEMDLPPHPRRKRRR